MYRAVIIGAGKIGAEFDTPSSDKILTHAHAFLEHEEMILAGFYDVDYAKAVHAAEIWGGQAFREISEALCGADVVSCCVPDQFHGKVLKEIAAYKPKLVITEKPVAVSADQAEEIRQIYQGKIPCMVNYSRRYIREFDDLRRRIRQYGRFLKGAGYYGKGILHNGSHMIDLMQYLLGNVEILERTEGWIPDLEGDPSVDVTMQIAQGVFSMLAVDSRIVTVFELDLFFEKARIRILEGGKKIAYYEIKESAVYQHYYNYNLVQTVSVSDSAAMQGLAENAVLFLKNGEEMKCTLEDGITVLQTCMQIQEM
ncbi:MAG: Gfo/Idh/MocA family oxidoreductase [Eubacterium sp.]|nr:Gfo/Idh/MocA family oxidoreductase [Eubacterium sp.]MCI8918705.1 Gfo/Idh/MocA family oxidoreductase [Eubacterium sp.]